MGAAPTFGQIKRRDREVTSFVEIAEILAKCPIARVAFHGEEYPYIVPLSFGIEITDEQLAIYFHCAPQGHKTECIHHNPHVCVEADYYICTEQTEQGITARYESFIGFGICEFLESDEEKIRALHSITDRYGYNNYPIESCGALARTYVGKVTFEQISGKRNLPASTTDNIGNP